LLAAVLALALSAAASAANNELAWATGAGSTGADRGSAVAVDGAGNVYTGGVFQGTVDFDPGLGVFNLTSLGSNEAFVQKLDANGDFLWAVRMGSTSADLVTGIAVDGAGNVYTTGGFRGTVDFDPGAAVSNLTAVSTDVFVQKLSSAGTFVWAKRAGGSGSAAGGHVAVDGAGDVYTIGAFQNTADVDPGAGVFNLTSAGSNDVFVQKLSSEGTFVWATRAGGTGTDAGQGIALDGAGNVYTSGFFQNTVDFDPGAGVFNLTSAGNFDAFVQKYAKPDADGDGVPDDQDAFPNDPTETTDTDGDGVGDNADVCGSTDVGDSVNADGCSAADITSLATVMGGDLIADPATPLDALKELGKASDALADAQAAMDAGDLGVALDEVADAVKHLSKAGKKGADADATIALLVEFAEAQAHAALAAAIAEPGDAGLIAKAEKEMAEALDELAKGHLDHAAKAYAKAFEEALKAIA
jgi:hypothetical protein